MSNEIILFESQDIKLEVNLKDETVWLSLEQMSKLFERDKSVISRHIKNIFKEELDNSTVANFATVQKEGQREITRNIEYYDLDVIISIGYRVKSKNGILFRKWANGVLKDYLIKGYAINNKRLEYLEKTVKLIDIANRRYNEDNSNDSMEILRVINEYAKALELLDNYDHKSLNNIKGHTSNRSVSYDDCLNIINELKYNEKSNIFALERNEGLKSILNDIYQTYDGRDIYPTVEEKCANFLYFVIKNHVFIDGNKRVAASLFLYFLQTYDLLYKDNKQIIDNNTLVALTLLIAQSDPKEKDILIDLVLNFLN